MASNRLRASRGGELSSSGNKRLVRPLTRAILTLRFNAGFYGCLAIVALVVVLVFGSSRVVALPTAGGILLLWMLMLRWIGLGPAESQMEAATHAPEDAPFASTRKHLGWLAGASVLIALPLLAVSLGGLGWLFHRVGEHMDAGISFGWWFGGMAVGILGGAALQFFFMARWMERWESDRGVWLFTELWPLPKRSLANPQARRRSRYYTVQTGKAAPTSEGRPREELPAPLSPLGVVLGSWALGLCALGVSGIFGEGALANAFRIAAGLGFVLLGLVLLKDWQGIRTRLAPRKGPALFKVFGALSLFVGGSAIVTGIAQLIAAA
jgi:hypothetical protein